MELTSSRPPVSIVVPVFNGERFLRECLDSLLTQTWTDLEIIVMDDASTDGTAEVARAYGDRITYFRQPANRGQFRNVEDGIARARGRYVAVYHADDVYDSDIVEREVACLEASPDVGLVFALVRFADVLGRVYAAHSIPEPLRGRSPFDYRTVLNGVLEFKSVFLPTPTAMARAELYAQAGPYRTEYGSAADLEMWLRLARMTRVALIEKPLINYRHTLTSAGQSYQRLRTTQETYFELMERHLEEYGSRDVTPEARRAFEAHRAVDCIRVAVNAYIQCRRDEAASWLHRTSLIGLLSSRRVSRVRHVFLWAGLRAACVLPHMAWLAQALYWRYYRRLPWWRAAERAAS